MSAITAVLLLFSRLSFDGELTALKASGVSLWQIISPILIVSIAFSIVCFWINSSIAPRCRHAGKTTRLMAGDREVDGHGVTVGDNPVHGQLQIGKTL